LKRTLRSLFFLSVGVIIGGYLFSQSQPRSVLSINQCKDCLSAEDLAGLLASAGIQKLPGLIPFVVFETDKTIAIKSPLPGAQIDYVIFPKKDIKNIGEIAKEDAPYLIDAYLVARHIIDKEKLSNYQFYTNGPGFQNVTYLHFHLIVKNHASHNSVK
jgi:diadenosine tetraphosphate (Ap4A) HIT family hydrolase